MLCNEQLIATCSHWTVDSSHFHYTHRDCSQRDHQSRWRHLKCTVPLQKQNHQNTSSIFISFFKTPIKANVFSSLPLLLQPSVCIATDTWPSKWVFVLICLTSCWKMRIMRWGLGLCLIPILATSCCSLLRFTQREATLSIEPCPSVIFCRSSSQTLQLSPLSYPEPRQLGAGVGEASAPRVPPHPHLACSQGMV